MATTNPSSNLTVIVPLFPRHPGLRHALAALRAQTLRPDLVVLLDHGKTADADALAEQLPDMNVQVMEVDQPDVADAINRAADFLDRSDHVAILGAGAAFAPRRLEKCLAALDVPERLRQPALVVSATTLVDSRGVHLKEDDPRHAQLARLWAPGRQGVGIPDWLGAGDFVLSAANLFARRSYLVSNPLLTGVSSFAYHAAIQAGVQGQLEVLDEPLLELNWSGPEVGQSAMGAAALLRAQVQLVAALRGKLNTSRETRRNFAAFHRAAWHNISGVREDLFAQAVLQLASLAPRDETAKVADRFATANDLLETPPHLLALRENAAADAATYAAALYKAREELDRLTEENERLNRVADAAQDSGWVRFGAWLGDRSARRIMEMEEENASIQPPDGEVEGGREDNPDEVGNKKP